MNADLWLVLRPFGIHDVARGRRDLRPGTIITLEGRDTASLEKRGYIRRIADAAPLFADSPDAQPKPMRRRKQEN